MQDTLSLRRIALIEYSTSDTMAADSDLRQRRANETPSQAVNGIINDSKKQAGVPPEETKSSGNLVNLVICVSGIYAAL